MAENDLPAGLEIRANLAGIHCALEILRSHQGAVLVRFTGHDIGEFGDAPFRALDVELEGGLPVEIFLDGRAVKSASIEVSGDWAQWMMTRRNLIYRFNILCASSYVEMTASFVQRFTGFGRQMRIYTDSAAFDLALRIACGAGAN